jgi:CMP-N-acetylneuraminic acid synthetase
MKIIGMIPARLGSKRVKKKNLRLIDGKPLISYVLDVVAKCKCFDEIYLNSEAEIFSEIAAKHNVGFYKRSPHLSTDTSTNDEFCHDFMKNIPGDVVIQILPTSPLITAIEIESFVEFMLNESIESLISVEEKRIACVYKKKPINFDNLKVNPPSQTMTPIQAYATVLMGWTYKSFIRSMIELGSAYHGGNSKVAYFPLSGLSTLDIDREEDFQLVEKIILARKHEGYSSPKYYNDEIKVDA